MMELLLFKLSMLVIFVSTGHAVFSQKFQDNLLQRVGLSITCFGSFMRLLQIFEIMPEIANARFVAAYGVAAFCMGTYWKFWRKP